jgi:hypothetical protein
MFRKIALAALAALTLGTATIATSAPADARPLFYRGGGWHGGGWGHRHWGGGGGWGWGAAGLITGLAAAPLLYGGYGGGYGPGYGGYGYDDGYYYDEPACGWRRVRVQTPYGWRIGRERVCY